MASAVGRYANGNLVEQCALSLRALRESDAVAKKVDAHVAALADDLENRMDECWQQVCACLWSVHVDANGKSAFLSCGVLPK